MAPHSSTLAWKIPWTEEPGRPQSMGSLRVGQDSATSLSLFNFLHWRRKWQPTPVFLPGEAQGWGARWAAVYGVTQSRIWLKWLSSSSSRKWLEYINKSNIWNKCPNMISRRSPRIMQITSSRFHFLLWWLGLIYLRMLPNKTNSHENDCSKANSLCYNCHLFY